MKTYLDWSAYQDAGMGDAYADIPKLGGDYAKAIAVCINSGACEQHGRGVMCPSYRISDNPILSTGGRVRLLKAALNSEQGVAAFDDAELVEAMDLCVSCKGCKRECENEVDMALIKTEYLAQRNANTTPPLRNRLFAALPRLLYSSSLLPTVIRWRNRSAWLAKAGERLLGISAKVKLPEPVPLPFAATDYVTDSQQAADNGKPEVVLFVDTFNRHFNPKVADAAMIVLTTAGYQVHIASQESLAQPLCCGRTYFANGMIDKAREQAQHLLHTLIPHVRQGRLIVGLEPSCILSLRDEYLTLGLGDEAKELAQQVLLFEEFIAKELVAKRWQLEFKPLTEQQFLIHGHCHQKAVGATKAMRKVLKLIPELDSKQIEASCCGMAGHFGLEAEHREHSQQMAEQGLYPALRAEPQATPIANGFSCQQQIKHGNFKPALHIAELLQAALPGEKSVC